MKLPYKKGKEVVFENVKHRQGLTLENKLTEEKFVILTAPEAQHKVRFVQACIHDGGVEVELGIEDDRMIFPP